MDAEKSENTATANVVALRLRWLYRMDKTTLPLGMQDLANVQCLFLTVLGIHALKDVLDLHLNILWILQQKIGNPIKEGTTHVFRCLATLMTIHSTNDPTNQSKHCSDEDSVIVQSSLLYYNLVFIYLVVSDVLTPWTSSTSPTFSFFVE